MTAEERIAALEQALLELNDAHIQLCRDVAGMAEANAERNAVADNKFVQVEHFRFMWGHEQALHEVKADLDREAAMNEMLFGKECGVNEEEFEAWAISHDLNGTYTSEEGPGDAEKKRVIGKMLEGKQVDRNGKWLTPRSIIELADKLNKEKE